VTPSSIRRSGRNEAAAIEVASRYAQLTGFVAMYLSRKLRVDVQPALTRSERANPSSRIRAIVAELVARGRMVSSPHVPNAIGSFDVIADLLIETVALALRSSPQSRGRDEEVRGSSWQLPQQPVHPGQRLAFCWCRSPRCCGRLLSHELGPVRTLARENRPGEQGDPNHSREECGLALLLGSCRCRHHQRSFDQFCVFAG
jgi:hypothetical protein